MNPNLKTYLLQKRFFDENNVATWIRQTTGMTGKPWQMSLSQSRHNGDRVCRIQFHDDSTEALFKLTFSDRLLDLQPIPA
jgi:hypothetical protein